MRTDTVVVDTEQRAVVVSAPAADRTAWLPFGAEATTVSADAAAGEVSTVEAGVADSRALSGSTSVVSLKVFLPGRNRLLLAGHNV